jgi:hypothetical protein
MSQEQNETLLYRVQNICNMLEKLPDVGPNTDPTIKFISGAVWLANKHACFEKSTLEEKESPAYKTFQAIKKALGEDEFKIVVHIGGTYLRSLEEMENLQSDVNTAIERAAPGKLIAADDLLPTLIPLFTNLNQGTQKILLSKTDTLFNILNLASLSNGKEGYALTSTNAAISGAANPVNSIAGLMKQKNDLEKGSEQKTSEIKELEKYLAAIQILEEQNSPDQKVQLGKLDLLNLNAALETKELISSINTLTGEIDYIALAESIQKEDEKLEGGSGSLVDLFDINITTDELLEKLRTRKANVSPPHNLSVFLTVKLNNNPEFINLKTKLNIEKYPNNFSLLTNQIKTELKENLETSIHPRTVFLKNKRRIILASIATAILLGGLTAIILLHFLPALLGLQIALPIFVALMVGGLTIAVGMTDRISRQTKQVLLELSMLLIATGGTWISLMELGLFAPHNIILTPLLGPSSGASGALLASITAPHIALVVSILLVTAIVLRELYQGSKKLSELDKVGLFLEQRIQADQKQTSELGSYALGKIFGSSQQTTQEDDIRTDAAEAEAKMKSTKADQRHTTGQMQTSETHQPPTATLFTL